jgi:hypothetical protein
MIHTFFLTRSFHYTNGLTDFFKMVLKDKAAVILKIAEAFHEAEIPDRGSGIRNFRLRDCTARTGIGFENGSVIGSVDIDRQTLILAAELQAAGKGILCVGP